MEDFPIDVEPEQLVRWIIAERTGAASRLEIVASCSRETGELPLRKEFRLGDEAREDVSEVVTLATLNIKPLEPSDGWSLTVVVEDDLGSCVSEEDPEAEEGEEQEIDLDTFYDEFLASGRGSVNVVAKVKDATAKQRLSSLLGEIVRDRHSSGGGAPPRHQSRRRSVAKRVK